MTVIAEVLLRGLGREQYDAVRAECRWIEDPPAGALSHVTWFEDGVCHNVDAWTDEESFAAFQEQRLAGAMARAGVTAELEETFHPAHEAFRASTGADGPTVPEELVSHGDLLRRGYELFEARDVPGVLALFADGIDWYTPDSVPFGGRFTGPQAVAEFFGRLPQHFAELHVEPHTFLESGDAVIVLGDLHARTVAGRQMDQPFVHVWTVREGKATRFTEFFDSAKVLQALTPDATPAPRAPADADVSRQPTRG